MLTNQLEARTGRVNKQTILIGVVVAILVILTAFAMVTVSRTFEVRPSDFVTLPTTSVSNTGEVVTFNSVSTIVQNNLATGVQGYLETPSGQPVVGANVYAEYYFEGAYRTQVGVTDSIGFFQINFPMNWTGWLPLTMVYFGDSQHQGVQQIFSLPGENL